MSEAINAPDDVNTEGVTEDGRYEESVCPALTPQKHGQYSRQHEAQDWHHFQIMPVTSRYIWAILCYTP